MRVRFTVRAPGRAISSGAPETACWPYAFFSSSRRAALLHSLINLDFSLKYVALNTSTDLPVIYRFTSLWAGQAGSLLLWSLILSIYSALVVLQTRSSARKLAPYVVAVLAAICVFFTYILGFVENPFETLPVAPLEGRGLNPILQNAYMAIHPVTLYLGYVGVSVPFAFGMGGAPERPARGRMDKVLPEVDAPCWTFLGVGLLLGARWAYLELGWGGYWAWDPVENAAFMPWLAATAFLHSVMIQENKGMLKKWNMSLIIITFFLAIFGTFITGRASSRRSIRSRRAISARSFWASSHSYCSFRSPCSSTG